MLDDPSQQGRAGVKPGAPGILHHQAGRTRRRDHQSRGSFDGRCLEPDGLQRKDLHETTRHLYAFGNKENNPGLPGEMAREPCRRQGRPSAARIIRLKFCCAGQTASVRIESWMRTALRGRAQRHQRSEVGAVHSATAKVRAIERKI